MITNIHLIINNYQYFELSTVRLEITISTHFSITQIRAKTEEFQLKQNTRCDDMTAKLTS